MNKKPDDVFIYPKTWINEDAMGFVATVEDWARKEIISKRLEYQREYKRLFAEKRKKLLFDIGLDKIILPEKYGGFGWNTPGRAPDMFSVFLEIGKADATIGFMAAIKSACLAIITMEPGMDESLLDELVPKYFSEEPKNVAVILPGPGILNVETPLFMGRSIMASVKSTKASNTVVGKDLRPTGGGADADLFCVVCADKAKKSCIAFVPSDAKGLKKGKPIKETGLNACTNADVSFEEVKVPKPYLVKRDNAVQEIYAWLNLLFGGISLGAAINFYEILYDWADTRTIKGGGRLKENPLCASVLADVAEEISRARLLGLGLAHIMAQSGDRGGVGSPSVYTFAQMIGSSMQKGALAALNHGMELMGSAGYAKEWHVEKHWRDIKTIQAYLAGVGSDIPVKMDIARFFYDLKEV